MTESKLTNLDRREDHSGHYGQHGGTFIICGPGRADHGTAGRPLHRLGPSSSYSGVRQGRVRSRIGRADQLRHGRINGMGVAGDPQDPECRQIRQAHCQAAMAAHHLALSQGLGRCEADGRRFNRRELALSPRCAGWLPSPSTLSDDHQSLFQRPQKTTRSLNFWSSGSSRTNQKSCSTRKSTRTAKRPITKAAWPMVSSAKRPSASSLRTRSIAWEWLRRVVGS